MIETALLAFVLFGGLGWIAVLLWGGVCTKDPYSCFLMLVISAGLIAGLISSLSSFKVPK
jgi:hypothetical protein